ncbi:Hydrophobin [Pleurotus pulmonarius]
MQLSYVFLSLAIAATAYAQASVCAAGISEADSTLSGIAGFVGFVQGLPAISALSDAGSITVPAVPTSVCELTGGTGTDGACVCPEA